MGIARHGAKPSSNDLSPAVAKEWRIAGSEAGGPTGWLTRLLHSAVQLDMCVITRAGASKFIKFRERGHNASQLSIGCTKSAIDIDEVGDTMLLKKLHKGWPSKQG